MYYNRNSMLECLKNSSAKNLLHTIGWGINLELTVIYEKNY